MDHPTSLDPHAVASETSRIALRVALAVAAMFLLLSWADAATTNAMLSDPNGRELNDHLLDRFGRLGLGFWASHLVLALALAEAARRGVGGMAALVPHLEQRSVRDVFRFGTNEGGLRSWRLLVTVTDVLLQGLIGPVSNLAEGARGFGVPGILVRVGTIVLGDKADVQSWVHYPAIYTVSILGFVFAAPISRAIIRRIVRAHPAVWTPVQAG